MTTHIPDLPRPFRQRRRPHRRLWSLLSLFAVASVALIWSRIRARRNALIRTTEHRAQEHPAGIRAWRQRITGDRSDAERTASTDGTTAASSAPDIAQAHTTISPLASVSQPQVATASSAAAQAMPSEPAPPPSVEDWKSDLEGKTRPEIAASQEPASGDARGNASSLTASAAVTGNGLTSEGRLPTPAEPATTPPAEGSGWIHAPADGGCPERYPIKGNASSRIYHRPGEPSYEATNPEICFASEEAATALGYRPRRR
jgi:hypothetical protein